MQASHKKNMRAFTRVFQESGIKAVLAKPPVVGSRFISYNIRLAVSNEIDKALRLEEPLALAAGVKNVRGSRELGHVCFEFELPKDKWKTYYRSSLRETGAIGLAAGGREIVMEWGQEHKIFGGGTGSGKTVAIKSAICALTEQYKPDALTIFLGTPHLQKDDFSVFNRLPHLGAEIAQKPDEIAGLIDMFYRIYKQREESGSDGHKVALILDEAQHTAVFGTKEGNTLNKDNLSLINQLATGSRGFDMRLIIGSQKPSQKDMPGILDNLLDRYVGSVSDAAVARQVTGLPTTGAQRLTGLGDFLHIHRGQATRFQVAVPEDYNGLASGPMNPLPAMMSLQKQNTVIAGQMVSFDGNFEMLGRLVAFILVRRQLPGRSTGKAFGMNWKQIEAFKNGFLLQMQQFGNQGTAIDQMAVKWFKNWLSQTQLESSNH